MPGTLLHAPQGLGMLTGKYDAKSGNLPKGPRGLLFRQILPGLEPLLSLMQGIAAQRRKSVSQARGSLLKRPALTCRSLHSCMHRVCMRWLPPPCR